MTPGTVRLQALSDLTRRPREAIRNAQKLGAAPWDETEFDEAPQRRYDGFHALALVLTEGLMSQKVSMEQAGEFVRAHETPINLFLDEITKAQPVTPRFVLGLLRAVEDSWFGPRMEPMILYGTGTKDEVMRCIEGALDDVGETRETRDGKSEVRVISGPQVAVVSIPEAYRLLRLRAEAAGFVVDGRRIFKIAKDVDGEAE